MRVRAIRPYKAEQDDHLSFPLGAVMFVVKRVDDNFFLGANAYTASNALD